MISVIPITDIRNCTLKNISDIIIDISNWTDIENWIFDIIISIFICE